MTDGEEIF